jgi:hypothetical protein
MWERWNQGTKIFEKSTDNGQSWTPLGLDASIITQGIIDPSHLPPSGPVDIAGLSVLGRAENTVGPTDAITAAADGDVLRRVGTALGFGALSNANLSGIAVESWTPVWSTTGTAPVLGNGTLVGRLIRLGQFVMISIHFNAGSSTTFGTGTWRFSYPTNAPLADQGGILPGRAILSGVSYPIISVAASAVLMNLQCHTVNTTGLPYAALTATAPFTWVSGASLGLYGAYFTS